jgi:predicted transcriptional regulator
MGNFASPTRAYFSAFVKGATAKSRQAKSTPDVVADVLRVLAEGGSMTVVELGAKVAAPVSAVLNVIEVLRRRGLVEGEQGDAASVVALTSDGKQLAK